VSALRALNALEGDLRAEVEHYHPVLLARQFLIAFVPLFAGLLAAYGWRPAWPQLWALLPGAIALAAERAWPNAPWRALLGVVRDAQAAAPRPAPPLPGPIATGTLRAPSVAPQPLPPV
jgi:hypothetical protein